ncbi:hypothetical protein EB796_008020 [Bugula neritina]|uniref:Uncharacterized protein n=1 Tax=Bugula neritina TaxID=10212 RepID=A0A7J7K4V1_BUGNE|nr:hypothetical protein EB796_008020 [Bugula neritina]
MTQEKLKEGDCHYLREANAEVAWWRYVKDEAGNIMTDEFGEKIRESNARMVKWSDGSLSLHVGSEIFEISSVPIKNIVTCTSVKAQFYRDRLCLKQVDI